MKNKTNIEYRTLAIDNFNAENNKIVGYAAIFEDESTNLGNFHEVIKRNAITDDVIKKSDIFACIDHDRSKVLARSRLGLGSLNLSIDERGLKYEFTLPNTPAGNELKSYLERGEITSSSFAFTVEKENWAKNGDTYMRSIEKVDRIYDVSPVFEPAYASTDVALRNLNDLKNKEIEEQNKKIDTLNKIKRLKIKNMIP
jgi:HK97 family phage prohead protease